MRRLWLIGIVTECCLADCRVEGFPELIGPRSSSNRESEMGPITYPDLDKLKWVFYLAIVGAVGILAVLIKCGIWLYEHVRFV